MRGWVRLVLPKSYMDRQRRAGFLFVLPAVLFFSFVYLLPLVQSVIGSFYRTVPGGASRYVGVHLYQKVLTDDAFWSAVRNTLSLLVMSVPVTVVLALAVALGLNRIGSLRWRSAWALMYFLPFASSLVAASMVWRWIYDPVFGILNYFLSFAGIPPQKYLQSITEVRPSIAVINIWLRLGFDTMIFLAGLQSIPGEFYEAAAIDGASGLQRLRRITIPLLNPQILMVCILELIFNFQIFDQAYATTQGGPAGSSETIIMLLYDTAFKFFRLGDASVIAVFVFVTLLVVTLLQWRIFRKPVQY
jgi:multiple sugar transport system permease protein